MQRIFLKYLTDKVKRSKTYAWVIVGLLWAVALLNYTDRQMLSTMKDSMQADIRELQSAEQFGALMAIFLWIYGLMSPVSGVIADRINKKWLIVASLLVWSSVTLLMGFADTFNQLYCLRAIMGVSEALYLPAGLALITNYHTTKTRALAVGIHMTGLYMGQALGGAGATIASCFSWRIAFQCLGLIGIVYSFVLALFLHEKKKSLREANGRSVVLGKPPLLEGFGILFTNISFWILLFYFSVPSLPGWAVKNWLPTMFAINLRIDMSEAGPLSAITIAVSSFLGVIFGGMWSDKWLQRNVRGRVYTSAIGTGLTIPALLLLGFGNSFFCLIGATFCFGFGFGMFDSNNMPILCQFVSARHRATAYGLMNMTGVFGGAFITNWLGKSTDEGHLGRDIALLSTIVMLMLLIQVFFLRPKENDFGNG